MLCNKVTDGNNVPSMVNAIEIDNKSQSSIIIARILPEGGKGFVKISEILSSLKGENVL